jgi:hypothetical protein
MTADRDDSVQRGVDSIRGPLSAQSNRSGLSLDYARPPEVRLLCSPQASMRLSGLEPGAGRRESRKVQVSGGWVGWQFEEVAADVRDQFQPAAQGKAAETAAQHVGKLLDLAASQTRPRVDRRHAVGAQAQRSAAGRRGRAAAARSRPKPVTARPERGRMA